MWKTIVRRILILIPQLFILSVIIFLLAQAMPGDALRGFVTPDMTAADVARMREIRGLNDPWYQQYGRWMRAILIEGDLGRSNTGINVSRVIGDRIGNTMRLSFLTTLFTYMIAIPLGVLAGRKHDKLPDKVIMVYTFIALSMPTIVISLINLLIFAFGLDWFPISGSVDIQVAGRAAMAGSGFSEQISYIWSRLHHLILPAITLALISTVGIIYYLRSEIIDYENSDFVLTARSKGVPENKIYSNHILRNASLPVASGIGFVIAGLFSGSIFIEWIFGYPGMGELFLTSINSRDFPVANVLIMFYAILTVVAITVSDIVISIVDPRIRIK